MYNKAKNLLLENPESFYWLGYLASDGSFKLDNAKKVSRISFRVNDKESVYKFKAFLNINNKITKVKNTYKLNVMDRATCQTLIDKYNVSNQKTYNPMIVRKLSVDNFISYLVGFIDGDGSIKLQTNRRTPKISIKCHSSWLYELLYWHSQLEKITKETIAPPKINNQGYCSWNIANLAVIKCLKLKTRKLRLPCLNRKWGLINLKIVNTANLRRLKRQHLKIRISEMLNIKMKTGEIAKKLKISPSTVSAHKKLRRTS